MNEVVIFILKSLYLMLPAYFANMAPVIVKKANLFNYPVDFNRKLGTSQFSGHIRLSGDLFLG